MGQGAVRWTLQRKLALGTKGTKESAGGAQGRRRREGAVEGIFHFHWKVKVAPNFVLIAVFVVFLSVLEEGLRPQVLHNKCFKISSSL